MGRADLLDPLVADPASAAVLLDFDGTLAPIVADPADARPVDGTGPVLEALGARFGVVAVVSGRPLAHLVAHLPAVVDLVGLYGLEWRRGGVVGEHPEAAAWRPVVAEVAERARRELPRGVGVEPKGASLTLHVRRHPELDGAVRAWAATASHTAGMVVRPAKASVELHPPVEVDKGTAVEDLAGALAAACFIGDDVGDLPAFDALDRLERAGRRVVRIAVESPEMAPELRSRADLVVAGPEGALTLLRDLAG